MYLLRSPDTNIDELSYGGGDDQDGESVRCHMRPDKIDIVMQATSIQDLSTGSLNGICSWCKCNVV